MHLITWMSSKPGFHLVSLVGRIVVHQQMNRHVLWQIGIHLFQKGQKFAAPVALFQSPITSPVAISGAANNDVVP